MFLYLILGAIEVIGIIMIYRFIYTYIFGFIQKKRYHINQDTIVLITGAAMGTGKLLALEFAKAHKCTIIIYDIRDDSIDSIIKDIEDAGARGYFYKCDISNQEELTQTVQNTFDRFKKIDILINNVGIANLKFFTDVEFSEIQKSVSITFLSTVSIIHKILPNMIARKKGHIVNVSSIASLLPSVKMTDYCSSKSALSGFHNALRLELKQYCKEIETTLICPFAVNTGVLQGLETKLKSLFPILDDTSVAKEIYNSILERKAEVFLPQSWKQGALFLRCLPTSLIDWLSINYLGKVSQKLTGKNSRQKEMN